jgi:type IV secretory pathway protease TraF
VDATVCVGGAPSNLSAQNHTAGRPLPPALLRCCYLAPPVYLVTLAALTW